MAARKNYLLDTCVLMFCIRGKKLAAYIEDTYHLKTASFRPSICVVSLGELHAMALNNKWGEEKIELIREIEQELVVVDIALPEVIEAYAQIDLTRRKKGICLSNNDQWIAATTKATGATLLTTDKDFDGLQKVEINREWIDPKKGK